MKAWLKWGLGAALLLFASYGYRKLIPVYRVEIRSDLVMLGDLNGDHRWGPEDLNLLNDFLADPFGFPDEFVRRVDLNQNGRIDSEDLAILRALSSQPDPYLAEQFAKERGKVFPRPRELYRYEAVGAYRARPLWGLPQPHSVQLLSWLEETPMASERGGYQQALEADLYNEATRLREAYRKRESGLSAVERAHAEAKLARCRALFQKGERFELLLELIALVEDAETLRADPSRVDLLRILRFRDHLRELLASPLFENYQRGDASWRNVLEVMEQSLKTDFRLDLRLDTLPPPRNLTHLQNYLQRAEWQYYKTSTHSDDFLKLLDYAQHDPRYLRAVSRTSKKHDDLRVENHNLPMVLLFREALRIKDGDKKRAVGLLDEAIRIPFSWVKSIPSEKLPGSLALDNFLLPGNKEDGSDKSRHWNVFGGICLYKSPEEALRLALQREMKDLRESGYAVEGMVEFIRDMIANLNGMYHVMAIDPNLLLPRNPRGLTPASNSSS
ncbi:hypothetical protein [Geothrix sp. 21YS21S-4]|uniref:hypothetical protein n=1 Tax=Geothrix sp. 21YS21S-4 TaxID=3068889 RepID=UPI0027B903D5|nr:hypothetical protein [Geothrix sp. 21YS21S-4]